MEDRLAEARETGKLNLRCAASGRGGGGTACLPPVQRARITHARQLM